MKKIIAVLCLVCVSLLVGCAKKNHENFNSDIDRNFYRVSMGGGFAQKENGYIYTQDFANVYETKLNETEISSVAIVENKLISCLNVLDDVLYYIDEDGKMVAREIETGITRVVYDKTDLSDVYVCDNNYAYALIGRDGPLLRISLKDGEYTELCDKTLMYVKYGNDIYYIWDKGDENERNIKLELWRYSEEDDEKNKFEEIENPITFVLCDEYIYYTTFGEWKLYEYNKSSCEISKIDIPKTYFYYVIDDDIFYGDEDEFDEKGYYSIKKYNKNDKTTEVVSDDYILNFTIFDDKTGVEFIQGENGYSNVYIKKENGEWRKYNIK